MSNLTNSQLLEIIDYASWVPSGDNCQPWTFSWDNKLLIVYHDSLRAHHLLNKNHFASMISLGAVIESIQIAASQFQHSIEVSYLDFNDKPHSPWAKIQFIPSQKLTDPLLPFLKQRCTDRRFFKKGSLNPAEIHQVIEGMDTTHTQVHVVTELQSELIENLIASEALLMEHDSLLPESLAWVRFSIKSAQQTKDGLSWRNLGAKFWDIPGIAVIKFFPPSMKFFKYILHLQYQGMMRKHLNNSAGLIVVSTDSPAPEQIVLAGRKMLRVWTFLNKQGYGVQPMSLSSLAPYGQMLQPDLFPFNNIMMQKLSSTQKALQKFCQLPQGAYPLWMLRTGLSSPLPAKYRTFRKPVGEIFQDQSLV